MSCLMWNESLMIEGGKDGRRRDKTMNHSDRRIVRPTVCKKRDEIKMDRLALQL